MKDLTGKLVLITGAASGIGAATARAFAAAGARLILCDVSTDRLAEVVAELGDSVVRSRRVDVADRAAMSAFADEVHRGDAAVDVLVNNAGVAVAGGILDTSLADWDWFLGINLYGESLCHHICVPALPSLAAIGHDVPSS